MQLSHLVCTSRRSFLSISADLKMKMFSRELYGLSPDLVRLRLLVLPNSGGDVGNYFTNISDSFGSAFTKYQPLTFLEELWMFDKSVKF